jgi:hypothetical protein
MHDIENKSGVTYNFSLLAVLRLSNLGGSFFVQICRLDFILKLSQLRAFLADFLKFSLVLFLFHLHLGHLSGKIFFKTRHVQLTVRDDRAICHTELLRLSRVEGGLSESHILIYFYLV